MKLKTGLVLALLLVLVPVQVLGAEPSPVPEELEGYVPEDPAEEVGEEVRERTQTNVGLFDKLVATLVNAVTDGVTYLLTGTSLKELIFGQSNPVSGAVFGENSVGNLFTASEWNHIINPLRLGFSSIAWLFFAVSIAFYGWKMMVESTNPLKRSDWQDKMFAYIGATALLALAHVVFFLLVNLNQQMVEGLYSYAKTIPLLESGFATLEGIAEGSSETELFLFDSIVYLAMAVMTLWLVVLYVFRKFMIALLVVIAPLAAWAFARNKDGMAFKLWAAELTSQIFIQTAHALVLLLYFGFLGNSLGDGSISGHVGQVIEPILLFVFGASAVMAAGAFMWNSLRLGMSGKYPHMRYTAMKGLQYSVFGFFISLGAILIVNMLRGLIF